MAEITPDHLTAIKRHRLIEQRVAYPQIMRSSHPAHNIILAYYVLSKLDIENYLLDLFRPISHLLSHEYQTLLASTGLISGLAILSTLRLPQSSISFAVGSLPEQKLVFVTSGGTSYFGYNDIDLPNEDLRANIRSSILTAIGVVS